MYKILNKQRKSEWVQPESEKKRERQKVLVRKGLGNGNVGLDGVD